MWLPSNWSKIIKLDSVSTFKTPDDKIYRAILRHPKLDEFDKKIKILSMQLQRLKPTDWNYFFDLAMNHLGD